MMRLLVLLALATAAVAAEPSPPTTTVPPNTQVSDAPAPERPRPCEADMKRLCGNVEPGARRLLGCLVDKREQLSTACRTRIDTIRTRRGRFEGQTMDAKQLRACRPDLAAHCTKVASGRGRWLECLRAHEAELSNACKTEIARTPPVPTTVAADGAAKAAEKADAESGKATSEKKSESGAGDAAGSPTSKSNGPPTSAEPDATKPATN